MKKKIYLVTGNHQLLISLKDYISLIKDFLGNDFDVIQSKNIQNSCINLIIDESSKEIFIKQIINSKPDTIFIYFLTEFFTKSKFLKINSFNFFSKNELVLLLIYILDKYEALKNKMTLKIKILIERRRKSELLRKNKQFNFYDHEMVKFKKLLYKFYRPKYESKLLAKFNKFILSVLLFNYLFFKYLFTLQFVKFFKFNFNLSKIFLLNPIKLVIYKVFFKNIDNFSSYRYMYQRCKGFKEIEHRIDFFLCSHKEIYKEFENLYNKKIFFILNRVKNIQMTNKRILTISGENNHYRERYISSLALKYPTNFRKFLKTDFLIKDEYGRYSINPKKTLSWKFSSPMRYILSINNNEIPIVTDEFSDDTSENLFLRMDFNSINSENLDKNYKIFIEKINSKIKDHNSDMKKIYFKVKNELELCFENKIQRSQ